MSGPIATVGALVINQSGDCLLIKTHKWRDRYGIPGGKIQAGETMLEALRRELLEETGLAIRDERLILVQDCIDSPEFYKPAHFLLINYVAWTDCDDVRLNDEAQSYRWIQPKDAFSLDLNSFTRRLLMAWQQS
jgi:phosphoglycolate phosphatase